MVFGVVVGAGVAVGSGGSQARTERIVGSEIMVKKNLAKIGLGIGIQCPLIYFP